MKMRKAKGPEKPAFPVSARQAAKRRDIRFLVLFSLYIVAGFSLLLAPFAQSAVKWADGFVAGGSAFLIRMFGGRATANGDLLLGATALHVIRIANGCNGLHVGVLLWSAIASFPAPLARKFKGLVVGTTALYVANFIRVITLFYLQPRGDRWFDLAHLYVWEALIILGTFSVFWLWARGAYPAAAAETNG
jgi:exosortase H (IPTLxxWG-CTERM-specific)